MTDETRETLERHEARLRELAVAFMFHPEDKHGHRMDACVAGADAMRDVLTPRTCSGCEHRNKDTGGCMRDVQDPEGSEVEDTESMWNWRNRDTFGCLGWQAREWDA